jgi:hypothetical protein
MLNKIIGTLLCATSVLSTPHHSIFGIDHIAHDDQTILLNQERTIDVFRINLDDPPEMRFFEPSKKYAKNILLTLEFYEKAVIRLLIPEQFQVSLDYGVWWSQRERYLEFQGIAQAIGVPTIRVLVWNYIYEFLAYCTSIVAKQQDGKILHMRLLDYGDVENTKNMTYIGEFYKNNTLLYKAVMTGGTPSSPTGYKEGKFSISLN